MIATAITPTFQQFYAALTAFIMEVTNLPASQVVQGLPNRAPMPLPGFISFQTIMRHRLRTSIDLPQNTADDLATITEGVELTVQIDCYGALTQTYGPGDWANMLCATLRDNFGCAFFENALGAGIVDPLYCDDARMIPLVAGEDQYEERWSVSAVFQLNPTTTIAQQYAEVLKIQLVNVPAGIPS